MSMDDMKAMARRIPEELFNKGNLDVADELVAADYVEHAAIPPGLPKGVPGLKMFVSALRAAFPDFHYTIDDEIGEGDTVVLRVTGHGTQQGEFAGMPATGKHAAWSEIHIARYADGMLVEHWVTVDQVGMLQQLGHMPAPGG